MVTKIQKWGNSQGLRIGKDLLQEAQIPVGAEVNVTVRDGLIIIAPVRQVRGRWRLEELVAAIPDGNQAEEVDWGRVEGREVW